MSKEIAEIKIFEKAQWIWAKDTQEKESDFIYIRRKFSLEKAPKKAIARIGCESSYNMYINGKRVIVDGGIARESENKGGYYDELDIAKSLKKGENAIVFECHYLGASGSNSFDAGKAGLIFECPEINMHSDSTFLQYRSPSYSIYADVKSSGLYAGNSIVYDSTREGQIENVFTAAYQANIFQDSQVLGEYPCAPWNTLVKRPIKLYTFPKKAKKVKPKKSSRLNEDLYTVDLGGACMFMPTFTVMATQGMAEIEVYTDRYKSSGNFYDEEQLYYNQMLKYICKNGAQTFTLPIPIYGTQLFLKIPKTAKLKKIAFEKVEFNTKTDASFECDTLNLDKLNDKAVDTIKVNMHDTFWNSPERERASTLAEISGASNLFSYAFDDEAMVLAKKTIDDLLLFSKDDVLYSRALGSMAIDIPAGGLIAFSSIGLVANYYNRTGDKDTIAKLVPYMINYLKLWEMDSNGLVSIRDGEQKYYDSGFNIDEKVLENALYYDACRFTVKLSSLFEEESRSEVLKDRMESISANFDDAFLKDGAYSSKTSYDDRANAWAVISTLAKPETYTKIAKILVNVQTCSPSFETYIINALCKMGYAGYAIDRVNCRFANFDYDKNPVLPEEFYAKGTQTYISSAGVMGELYRGVAGVQYFDGSTIVVTPNLGNAKFVKFYCYADKGVVSGHYKKDVDKLEIFINNATLMTGTIEINSQVLGILEDSQSVKLEKGKKKLIFTVK